MPKPYQVKYTIRDRKNKISTMTVYLQLFNVVNDVENDVNDVENAIVLIGQYIDAMINGAIVNVSYTRNVPITGIKTTATSTADVEEKGVFVFSNSIQNQRITIPTFKDSLVIDGSDRIDTTNTDVSTFIFGMTDGSATILETVVPTDNRDLALSGFVEAFESFRRSSKR